MKCEWCQKIEELENELLSNVPTEALFICSDCLINILPTTFREQADSNETEEPFQDNRRQVLRFPLISQILLTTKEHPVEVHQVLLLDISDKGIKLQLKTPLGIGDMITMGILTKKLSYRAIGQVVRYHEIETKEGLRYEAGVHLTGIHQDLVGEN